MDRQLTANLLQSIVNMNQQLITAINDCLPQTQCQLCGYADCMAYAEAVASGEAIHLCQPGGQKTQQAVARISQRQIDATPIHIDDHVVVIDEQLCIGCVKCITACPVIAIVGAAKKMHTVIASECTGCDLCIPVCPVDCIYVVPAENPLQHYADTAMKQVQDFRQQRYQTKKENTAQKKQVRKKTLTQTKKTVSVNPQQLASRTQYQIARLQKAIEQCQKKNDYQQIEKLKIQLARLAGSKDHLYQNLDDTF